MNHAVKDEIVVTFPKDCKLEEIVLFNSGEKIDVNLPQIERRRNVTLMSNFIDEEGDCYLVLRKDNGNEISRTSLGTVDIKWKLFKERNNHKGKVIALLEPSIGKLTVKVKLNKVGLHHDILGDATIHMDVRGGFDHVK